MDFFFFFKLPPSSLFLTAVEQPEPRRGNQSWELAGVETRTAFLMERSHADGENMWDQSPTAKQAQPAIPEVLVKALSTQKVNSWFFSYPLSSPRYRNQGSGRSRTGRFLNYRPRCNVFSFIFRRLSETIEEIIQKKFVQTACHFEEVKLNQKKKKKPQP